MSGPSSVIRQYHYGVRVASWSFFWGVLLAAIWAGHEYSQIQRRARAVAMIDKCGGTVIYDYQWSPSKAWLPNAVPPGPKWLRQLLGDKFRANAVEVQLFAGPKKRPEVFTDAEAKQLSVLTEVQWLVLMDTNLTDAGLKHLSSLKKLERLDLEGTPVTEAGVQKLHRALPKVRIFYDDNMIAPE